MWSAELLAARLVLGVIFLFSSVGKVLSSRALVDAIMDYRLLSRRQARIAAPLLPVSEIVFRRLMYRRCGPSHRGELDSPPLADLYDGHCDQSGARSSICLQLFR